MLVKLINAWIAALFLYGIKRYEKVCVNENNANGSRESKRIH